MGAIDSKNGAINIKFEGTEKRTAQGGHVKRGVFGQTKKGRWRSKKRGGRAIKKPPRRGQKRGRHPEKKETVATKKEGEVFANCNQLRRSCFRQQAASSTTKRRKSGRSTAARSKTAKEQRSPARRERIRRPTSPCARFAEPVGKTDRFV